LGECRLLKRPIWLGAVWVPATEGPSVLLCQIDAQFRRTDNVEQPEEHRDSLQG